LPHAFGEGVAAQVVAGFAFLPKLTLDDHLRRDTGVIGARLPQGIVTLHAMVANQRIHDRILEGVTHVQAAGHVRWRDHDAVGVAVAAGGKITLFFPALVPGLFNRMRIVSFVHLSGGANQRARLYLAPCAFCTVSIVAGRRNSGPVTSELVEFFLDGEFDFLPGEFHVFVEDASDVLLERRIVLEWIDHDHDQLGVGIVGLAHLLGPGIDDRGILCPEAQFFIETEVGNADFLSGFDQVG
jgi:hypothetical protein